MELKDKVVIVTGAAGFLGSGCAREMANQGARLLLVDRPGANVQAIVGEIVGAGGEAVAHEGDIGEEADVVAMMEMVRRAFGGVDALANVAAAMQHIAPDRSLEAMTVAIWDQVMATNLRGTMLCCKHAMPMMLARGAGAIVNFSSTAGLRGDVGLIAYSTSKAGLLGFSQAVAATYGKQGIRCNAVCPGSVWTDATKAALGEEALALMERTRLTPRLGVPADIAHMVVFLCSDKASYVTGQVFVVDGGGTSHQPWVHMR